MRRRGLSAQRREESKTQEVMRFNFFESLSREEAIAFLDRFLKVEPAHVDEMLRQCLSDGVPCSFGVDSVGPVMRWVAARLKTVSTEPNTQLPEWIRETDSYTRNLFEFDETSKLLTVRVAYFLGESFVRSFRGLHWKTGNLETAEANMPVVAPFQHDLEMAPILIAENLFRRVIAEPSKLLDIDKAVEYWAGQVL